MLHPYRDGAFAVLIDLQDGIYVAEFRFLRFLDEADADDDASHGQIDKAVTSESGCDRAFRLAIQSKSSAFRIIRLDLFMDFLKSLIQRGGDLRTG